MVTFTRILETHLVVGVHTGALIVIFAVFGTLTLNFALQAYPTIHRKRSSHDQRAL